MRRGQGPGDAMGEGVVHARKQYAHAEKSVQQKIQAARLAITCTDREYGDNRQLHPSLGGVAACSRPWLRQRWREGEEDGEGERKYEKVGVRVGFRSICLRPATRRSGPLARRLSRPHLRELQLLVDDGTRRDREEFLPLEILEIQIHELQAKSCLTL